MKRLHMALGCFALAGFVASVLVHLTALSGIDVEERIPYVWALHAGIFLVFVPFALLSRRTWGTRPTWAQMRAAFPRWVLLAGGALVAYGTFNFALFMAGTEGGTPSFQDGKHVLLNHGALMRELTMTEYTAMKANVVRGFSGHWMVFYFMPLAFFFFKKESSAVIADGDRTIAR